MLGGHAAIALLLCRSMGLVFVVPEGAYDMLIHLAGPDVQFDFGVLSHCVIR